MEYGRDRKIENGRKRNANGPKQRQEIEKADAEIRICERGIACMPALKSPPSASSKSPLYASGGYLGRAALRRVATHNDTDAFVIHVTIVRDVGYTKCPLDREKERESHL